MGGKYKVGVNTKRVLKKKKRLASVAENDRVCARGVKLISPGGRAR